MNGLTTSEVARRYGIKDWMVRRLYEKGALPEPGRFGRFRVVAETDLPKVEAALRKAKYLREPSAVA